jgi:hypothetical protein
MTTASAELISVAIVSTEHTYVQPNIIFSILMLRRCCLHRQGDEWRTSETSVDNCFAQQYIPEDKSELHTRRRENLKSHKVMVQKLHEMANEI